VTAGWTDEDARILKKFAWKICYAATAKREIRLAKRIAHWPQRVFAPSQMWVATLNV
jgi:hypothetical protein